MRAAAFLIVILAARIAAAPQMTMEKINERELCVRDPSWPAVVGLKLTRYCHRSVTKTRAKDPTAATMGHATRPARNEKSLEVSGMVKTTKESAVANGFPDLSKREGAIL